MPRLWIVSIENSSVCFLSYIKLRYKVTASMNLSLYIYYFSGLNILILLLKKEYLFMSLGTYDCDLIVWLL